MDELDKIVAELDAAPPGPALVPVDWSLLDAGVPEHPYLERPYLPARARILAVGPAESVKSMWAMHASARLTMRGHRVVFVSQENPLAEDLRRLARMPFSRDDFLLLHDQGIDLARAEHVAALADVAAGASMIVLDTLTACWSGDENSNEAIAGFDRDALQPLVRDTGASVLVLDHTGHPSAFVNRDGVSAARGASAKAQKADAVLVFKPGGNGLFAIHHAKNRFGGRKAAPASFRVIDTDDDALDIAAESSAEDERVRTIADAVVAAIEKAGELSTRALRAAVGGGRDLQSAALALLESEDPPRVVVTGGTVDTPTGRKHARVWRPAGQQAIGAGS